MSDGSSALRSSVSAATTRRRFLGQVTVGLSASALTANLAARGVAAEPRPTATPPGRPTALVYDAVCKCHVTGEGRPECPQRYDAVLGALMKTPYFAALRPMKPRPATNEEILACHSAAYLALAEREIAAGAKRLSTGDTNVCPDSMKAARYAGGAACVAVDAVFSGSAKNSFCLTRPPGHHATAERGMGFCVLNNVAIATRYAQRKYRVGKVLIVDWDVHHGNGTQDIFYDDPSVFYFSTHQSHWYPGTGATNETGHGKGLGTTLNCPMAAGAAHKEFFQAFHDQLSPAVDRFKPELIMVSAGFDARHGDPLGRFELLDADYIELTGLVLAMARQYANGRLVSVLEGGYNLTGLASAAAAHCGRLQQG